MSDDSGIEWTEATWNPVRGCTKVSPGCDNCYAETFAERFRGVPGHAYEQGFDPRTAPSALLLPLRWRRARLVFVNSMSDLFHDAVPDEYIAQVFAVMALAGQHTFQLLTKRHGRMRALLNDPAFRRAVDRAAGALLPTLRPPAQPRHLDLDRGGVVWPVPNLWLGVSTESQQWADVRIPALLATPAAVRWISAEPLLGALHLRRWLPSQEPQRLGSRSALDDEVGQQGRQDRVHVSGAAHDPRAHRLPPAELGTPVIPTDDAAHGRLEPLDDLGRGAVDRHADRAAVVGQASPIEVPLPVEHAGDVAEDGWVGGHHDGLGGAGRPLPPSDPTCGVDPAPNGAPARPDSVGDLLDGLSGDVGSERLVGRDRMLRHDTQRPTLDWVVVGGESGAGARPMDVGWARGLVAQCAAVGVPAFVKQLGTVAAREAGAKGKGGDPNSWPEDLRVRQMPAAHERKVHA